MSKLRQALVLLSTAVLLRGDNTSLLHNCGVNFKHLPMSDFVSGPFLYPCPRTAPMTGQIHAEPTYVAGRPHSTHIDHR